MTHPIDDNLDIIIERFAREDDCTPHRWRYSAIRSIVGQRLLGEAAFHKSDVINIYGFRSDDTPIQPMDPDFPLKATHSHDGRPCYVTH